MSRKLDLTQGKIFTALIKLATPILATSLIQMAYTLTDMIWLGRVGSAAVAGAGTAGFFIWLGFGVILISKVGTEVMVAQTTGKKDINSAANYARNGLQFNFLSALIYGVVLLLNRNRLIDFFHLHDPLVEGMAFQYLTVVTCGLVFYFINPVLSGIFNGSGDSRTP
ncbi:MAG: MATE family efflux transporter, partial [Candidatus Cloacimonetes bacterium]|nr:MATE family efflux transporter [Candidatus Cloacimonadota bacterium]